MSDKRLLVIAPNDPATCVGGAERALFELMQGLLRRGWSVDCISGQADPIPLTPELDNPPWRAVVTQGMDMPKSLTLIPLLATLRHHDIPVICWRHGFHDNALFFPDFTVVCAETVRIASAWGKDGDTSKWPIVYPVSAVLPELTDPPPPKEFDVLQPCFLPHKGLVMTAALIGRCPDLTFAPIEWPMDGLAPPRVANCRAFPILSMPAALCAIAQSRALLFPTFAETFGRVAWEAAVLGTPVVATDLPALREAIGFASWLPPDADLDAWEDALRETLAGGPAIAQRTADAKAHATRLHQTAMKQWDALSAHLEAVIRSAP